MLLGDWPTPLTPWPDLARALGLASLHLKREDLADPRYGGNKLRGLEYLLGAARARGVTRVVAYGPEGSNWCTAAAVHAPRAGLACDLIYIRLTWIERRMPAERVAIFREAARRAARLAASTRWLPLWSLPGALLRRALERGTRVLPPGGTSPVAALGHVAALLELEQAVARGEIARPDAIYVALGSGGTAAGLAAGAALLGWPTRVVGARVSPRVVSNAWVASWLARRTLRLLGSRARPAGLAVDHSQAGAGYRLPTAAASQAQELTRGLPGGPLDLTYTAKAFAALVADARAGRLAGRRVVFWQTLGTLPERRGSDSGSS